MSFDTNRYMEELKTHFEEKKKPYHSSRRIPKVHLSDPKGELAKVINSKMPLSIQIPKSLSVSENLTMVDKKIYNQWISVKDRLPTIKEIVAYVYADGEIFYEKIWFDHCTKKWMENCPVNAYVRCPKNVTHWMPPIQPPEEK